MDVSNNMKDKVMLALTVCQGYRLCDPDHCQYGDKVDGHECLDSLHEDALALLKAQEPVEPIPGLWDRDIQLYKCGACGGEIGAGGIAKYCFHCGQAVKWE